MRTSLYATAISFVCALILGTTTTFAYDCDSLVADEAGVFGDGFSRVAVAAEKLDALGARIRVRTVRNFGNNSNLDRYEAAVERQCVSWQSANGGTGNNLIVVMLEIEHREIGLYYGDLWKPALDSQWLAIKDRVIIPRLRDGNLSGAFAEGLTAIAKRVEEQLNSPTVAPVVPAPSSVTVIQSEPTDLSGLWVVLGGAVVFGVVILLVVFIARSRERKRQEEEVCRAAQSKAKIAKSACIAPIGGADMALQILGAKINTVAKDASDDDVAPLRNALRGATKEWNDAKTAFAQFAETSRTDPNTDDLTASEYTHLTERYGALGKAVMKADERTRATDTEADVLLAATKTIRSRLSAAEEALEASRRGIAEVAATGYFVKEPEEQLVAAETHLKGAKQALEAKKISEASILAKEATVAANNALELARGLSVLRKQVGDAIAPARTRFEAVGKKLGPAASCFRKMEAEFAELLWVPVAGNGTEAENRLAWADEALAKATAGLAMDKQGFSASNAFLTEATSWLTEADGLLEAISETEKRLTKARASAESEIRAAEADIIKADDYIRAHDSVIDDDLDIALAKAKEKVADARTLLGTGKPDYIRIVKLALAANAEADKILDQAQSQREAAERKRQRLHAVTVEASRSIDAAHSYIRSHGNDVGQSARSALNDAERSIKNAQVSGNQMPDAQIQHAESADRDADAALERAKRDVRDAEDRRRRQRAARDRDDDFGSSWGSSRSTSSSSSSDNSGGSSGFGFGGGSGGGSSGFGGGGGRSGGSSKW